MSAKCGSCGAEFFWATTPNGRGMPVDVTPAADGNVAVVFRGPTTLARVLKKDEAYEGERYKSHFATCPGAGQHRRPK